LGSIPLLSSKLMPNSVSRRSMLLLLMKESVKKPVTKA